MNNKLPTTLKVVNLSVKSLTDFTAGYVDCIVKDQDGRILIQKRSWSNPPGALTTFGGKIEPGENVDSALIRELNEELGADVPANELILLGAVTEIETQHSEIVYCYYWQDKEGTVTGCYEGELEYFSSAQDVIDNPKSMAYVKWFMHVALSRDLVS